MSLDLDELRRLLQPLITTVSEYNTDPFPEHLLEKEAPGILAWGVQSGYFLWVREHPGQLPTLHQVGEWLKDVLAARAGLGMQASPRMDLQKKPTPKRRRRKKR